MADYGNRNDGTKKGEGWLGAIRTRKGSVMTELSVGVEIDGKETEIPTVVPTLTKEEVDYLANIADDPKGQIPDSIIKKAVEHARKQINQGKSPFKE